MKKTITICLVVCFVGLFVVSGCETSMGSKTTQGTLIGGVVGAGAGQLIGRDTTSTLIGAGLGAGAGYLLGSQADHRQQTQRELDEMRGQMNTVTVWVTNSNGSEIPIRLQKDGYDGYIGPRGERYKTMPSEDQLRMVYGF